MRIYRDYRVELLVNDAVLLFLACLKARVRRARERNFGAFTKALGSIMLVQVVYICLCTPLHHDRSYHTGNTVSHSYCVVKSCRARLVLSWGTSWEARVTIVFF